MEPKKTMLWGGFEPWSRFIYFFVLALCFLLFQQGDLAHTTASSYAYLHQHFFDFYEYNKKLWGGNDYLPIIYIFFALWNVPLLLAGLLTPEKMQVPVVAAISIAWAKLLPVLFFFGSVKVIRNIAELIPEETDNGKAKAAALFATAPIAVFAVFIFSGYDVIGLFFTLLGFYYYLKKDYKRFSWFFSVAICFKYFALCMYVPLVLLVEKKILNVVKFMLIGLLLTGVQIIAYSGSAVFRQSCFHLALGKATTVFDGGSLLSILKMCFVLAYVLGCCYLYVKKCASDHEWKRMAVCTPIAAYGLFFSSVSWHPQWLITVMPFFCLAYHYVKNKRLFAYMDLLGMLAFVWICVNAWPNNVDVSMLSHGVLGACFRPPPLLMSDLMCIGLVPVFAVILKIYLIFPILLIFGEWFFSETSRPRKVGNGLLFARFCLGTSFFLIPALLCAFLPLPLASKLRAGAHVLRQNTAERPGAAELAIGESVNRQREIRPFTATSNGRSAVPVRFAPYARQKEGAVTCERETATGTGI